MMDSVIIKDKCLIYKISHNLKREVVCIAYATVKFTFTSICPVIWAAQGDFRERDIDPRNSHVDPAIATRWAY